MLVTLRYVRLLYWAYVYWDSACCWLSRAWKQWSCGLSGHFYLLEFGHGSLGLRCDLCGKNGRGWTWTIRKTGPVVRNFRVVKSGIK